MSPLSRGTTLFEACLVVAIIGSLTIMAVPSISRAREAYGLAAAAYQVRAELHRARILAIVRNQDCRLRVTSAVTYLVECQTPAWVTIASHELARGFTMTANASPEFHPLGNVGPMATVSVFNVSGAWKRVIVNRSGRIRIE